MLHNYSIPDYTIRHKYTEQCVTNTHCLTIHTDSQIHNVSHINKYPWLRSVLQCTMLHTYTIYHKYTTKSFTHALYTNTQCFTNTHHIHNAPNYTMRHKYTLFHIHTMFRKYAMHHSNSMYNYAMRHNCTTQWFPDTQCVQYTMFHTRILSHKYTTQWSTNTVYTTTQRVIHTHRNAAQTHSVIRHKYALRHKYTMRQNTQWFTYAHCSTTTQRNTSQI